MRTPILVLAVLSLLAGACAQQTSPQSTTSESTGGESEPTGGEDTGELERIDLLFSYRRSLSYVADLMAESQGFYADEGLDINVVPTEGSSFVTQQLVADNAKYGIAVADGVMIANSQGEDLKSIAQLTHGSITLMTLASSGIASIDDLSGEALGITDFGGGEVPLAEAVLADAGLSDDVELVPVGAGGASVVLALESGDVAGYMGYANDIAAVEASAGELQNILPEEFKNLPADGLVVSSDVLNNPQDLETASGIVRAWARGIAFAQENPDEALEAACDLVPEECLDAEVAQAFFELSLDSALALEGYAYGEYDFDKLETVRAYLSGTGSLGSNEFDIRDVFPPTLTDRIDDNLVATD